MPLHMPKLEQQLKNSQDALSAYVAKLDAQGVDKADRSKNAKYRSLNSSCSKIRSRMKNAQSTLDRDAGVTDQSADDGEE